MTAKGQFGKFTPSRLSDRNGFVEETLAGTGATAGNAPEAVIARARMRPQVRPTPVFSEAHAVQKIIMRNVGGVVPLDCTMRDGGACRLEYL
jgi:hypothetical protein